MRHRPAGLAELVGQEISSRLGWSARIHQQIQKTVASRRWGRSEANDRAQHLVDQSPQNLLLDDERDRQALEMGRVENVGRELMERKTVGTEAAGQAVGQNLLPHQPRGTVGRG